VNVDRRYLIGLAVVLVFIAVAVSYAMQHRHASTLMPSVSLPDSTTLVISDDKGPKEIQVYVGGAVSTPGVYRLQQGDRVHQALALAGPLPGADLRYLGMARELIDGESILVPDLQAMAAEQGQGIAAPGINAKININRATAAELDAGLDGIGMGLAQRIVDYRVANGPFKKIEDIKKVGGIGEKRYEAIKDQISVY
jgi:competence protein ComEA